MCSTYENFLFGEMTGICRVSKVDDVTTVCPYVHMLFGGTCISILLIMIIHI
jgi:hypothetical protein